MKEPPRTIAVGVLLPLLAALVSGGLWAWRSPVEVTDGESAVRRAARASGMPVVDTTAMREIVDSGSRLLLDARPLSEYDQGHLPGALSLPYEDFETAFPSIAAFLAPTDPVVVYCSGPRCDEALRVAERLREAGFQRVSLYVEGWRGWR